ncbi:MAG: GIY-YIG nuclease family protein [Candidatus Binataceae bacterium]
MKDEVRRQYCVYIAASLSRTLYIGVTNDLERRIAEHKAGILGGFTCRYHVNRLVYFEDFDDIKAAIEREKQIKAWTRAKKIALVETMNPNWRDLCDNDPSK